MLYPEGFPCAPMTARFVAEQDGYGSGYPGQLGPQGCGASACEAVYAGHHPLACVACKACSAVQAHPSGWCQWQKVQKPNADWSYACKVAYPGQDNWMIVCAADGPHVMVRNGEQLSVPADVQQEVDTLDYSRC